LLVSTFLFHCPRHFLHPPLPIPLTALLVEKFLKTLADLRNQLVKVEEKKDKLRAKRRRLQKQILFHKESFREPLQLAKEHLAAEDSAAHDRGVVPEGVVEDTESEPSAPSLPKTLEFPMSSIEESSDSFFTQFLSELDTGGVSLGSS